MSQSTDTAAVMTAKAAPPLTVLGAKLSGMPVATWIEWMTFVYLGLMIGHKGWQIYKEYRDGRKSKE